MGQGDKKRSSDLYSTFQEGSFKVVFHVFIQWDSIVNRLFNGDYIDSFFPRLVIY